MTDDIQALKDKLVDIARRSVATHFSGGSASDMLALWSEKVVAVRALEKAEKAEKGEKMGEARDIQALRDKVVEAAKAVTDGSIREVGAVYDAVAALRAAEEAAKRPRLTDALVLAFDPSLHQPDPGFRARVDVIHARDAEWIAAITPLAREVFDGSRIVRLDDILALAKAE